MKTLRGVLRKFCLNFIGTIYCLHRALCSLRFYCSHRKQLISSGDRLTCFLRTTVVSGKHTLKRTFLKFLDDCFYMAIFLFLCIWQYKIFEQKLSHKCAMINSQGVNISDKNYNSILFLNISLSVQLNHSRGHHLGFMPVSITQ